MSDWLPDPNRPQVTLQRHDIKTMIRLARVLRQLSKRPAYLEAITTQTNATTPLFDPQHESVMMGYDFHLTADGPRLIEVNTNAGGSLMAQRALQPCFPPGPRFPDDIYDPEERRQIRLLNSFAQEMRFFSQGQITRPQSIVILDDAPEQQFLYTEMQAFATLCTQWGCETVLIAAPAELTMNGDGVFHQGRRIDMIYNRHCDFYLESKELAGLKAAWLNHRVCLTPNPYIYWLLADKQRMVLWSDPVALDNLGSTAAEIEFITTIVPTTRYFYAFPPNQLWAERNRWIFKPFSGFGSRGVLLGSKISRTRFNSLEPSTMLVQQFIPPSITTIDQQAMKTDFRLFFYRDQPLGVTARIYQGQVTNFQVAGNRFMPIKIVSKR